MAQAARLSPEICALSAPSSVQGVFHIQKLICKTLETGCQSDVLCAGARWAALRAGTT